MSRVIRTPRHEALRAFIVAKRKKKGLRQVDLAELLGRNQSYVTDIETGTKIIGAIELIDLAEALDFDPAAALRKILVLK
jgi:transcriptional regulator with XRE-family HTH domain